MAKRKSKSVPQSARTIAAHYDPGDTIIYPSGARYLVTGRLGDTAIGRPITPHGPGPLQALPQGPVSPDSA